MRVPTFLRLPSLFLIHLFAVPSSGNSFFLCWGRIRDEFVPKMSTYKEFILKNEFGIENVWNISFGFFFSEMSASSELSSELIFELMRRDRPAGRSASGLGQKVDLFWTPSILCVRQLFRSSFGTSVSPVRWEHEYPVRGCHRSILFQWMTY